jgi:hypothetical protein
VQEICTLRAMRRALETESRKLLTGHEGGNAGNSQGSSYGFTRQRSTLPAVGPVHRRRPTLQSQPFLAFL